MIKGMMRWGIFLLAAWCVCACRGKEMPLDKERFTALLIDMHRVDGTLAVNRGMRGGTDLKNYAYYNELFRKYGITRADFDSCMYYYSAQTQDFSQMYDVIIDSLNREVTQVDKLLNELKAKDSVNYFPVSDTLRLDSVLTFTVDSIVPGLYKFSIAFQFDSASTLRTRRIASYFVSADNRDTLKVRDIVVSIDTNRRDYNWSQYADSVYSRLVVTFPELIPQKERPKVYRKGKPAKPEKREKEIRLEEFGGRAWDIRLYRPYISRETEKRMKQNIRR